MGSDNSRIGLLAPIKKPGKDPFAADSYAPVTLLSVKREILSKILMSRTKSTLERNTEITKCVSSRKNHWGCCSCQQKPFSTAKMEDKAKTCIGRDVSKIFDKLDSVKLL